MTDPEPAKGSPAGEPTPKDKPTTTTGPSPQTVQQWQEASPGRSATTPAGPGSRDTPAESADAAKVKPSSETRPPRPLAAKQGAATNEPATGKPAAAPPANQDALVEAITKRLADNLAKALRQSVVEAVAESQAAAASPPSPDAPATE